MPANALRRENYSSSSEVKAFDLTGIYHRYGLGPAPAYEVPSTTSDITIRSFPEPSDEEYWGSDADWEAEKNNAPSTDEFDEVVAYLLKTGQASI